MTHVGETKARIPEVEVVEVVVDRDAAASAETRRAGMDATRGYSQDQQSAQRMQERRRIEERQRLHDEGFGATRQRAPRSGGHELQYAAGAIATALAGAAALGFLAARRYSSARDEDHGFRRGERTGKRLIETDRVEGASVYAREGTRLGVIKRIMLDKMSGRAAYAVMSSGGILGMGAEDYALAWNQLDYDPHLGGYRTSLSKEQARDLPTLGDVEKQRRHQSDGMTASFWLIG